MLKAPLRYWPSNRRSLLSKLRNNQNHFSPTLVSHGGLFSNGRTWDDAHSYANRGNANVEHREAKRQFKVGRFPVGEWRNPRDPSRASAGEKEKKEIRARRLPGFFMLPHDAVFRPGTSVVRDE